MELENEVLSEQIKAIFLEHKSRYGRRRIKHVLSERFNINISGRRIGNLMDKQGLVARGKIKYRYRHGKSKESVVYENLLKQNFQTNQKNKIWFGDITYIQTGEGTLYLSVFLDLFNRKCVGYSLREHMRDTMVIESLKMAVEKEKPNPGLIIHTDQGSQYTCGSFHEYLRERSFIASHSRRGNPYDNAVMESFYKSLKIEILPKHSSKTKEQAVLVICDYLENYYNQKRIHSALGYSTPASFGKVH